jgi:hypothetical protein
MQTGASSVNCVSALHHGGRTLGELARHTGAGGGLIANYISEIFLQFMPRQAPQFAKIVHVILVKRAFRNNHAA